VTWAGRLIRSKFTKGKLINTVPQVDFGAIVWPIMGASVRVFMCTSARPNSSQCGVHLRLTISLLDTLLPSSPSQNPSPSSSACPTKALGD